MTFKRLHQKFIPPVDTGIAIPSMAQMAADMTPGVYRPENGEPYTNTGAPWHQGQLPAFPYGDLLVTSSPLDKRWFDGWETAGAHPPLDGGGTAGAPPPLDGGAKYKNSEQRKGGETMNLLSTIGRGIKGAGRGILSGIDNAAVNSLTGGGLMDAALGSNGQPFTPTDQQRKGLRGQYLMGIGSALQQGRPIAEGIQQYQQNAIGQIQAGQQAQYQNKARDMRASFQSELQAAGTPEAQRSVMVKWAPFFPKEVQDLAGAIKATKPDVLTIKSTDTFAGVDGKPVLVDTFSDGTRRTVVGYTPKTKITWVDIGGEKVPLDEQGHRVTGLPSLVMGQSPDSRAQGQRMQPLITDQGIVSYNPTTGEVATVTGADGKSLMPFRQTVDTSGKELAREDRSYQFQMAALERTEKPIAEALSRSQRLIETLNNGSPVALAAAIPEFLTVMAGGAGSNLKMSEAEMKRIVGGRSVWEDLTAAASRFSANPQQSPLTTTQVANVRKMAQAVTSKLAAKQEAVNAARNVIGTSTNVVEHRNAFNNMRMKFQAIDGGGGEARPSLTDIWSK